jgi:predicted Zn-dependent protease
VRFELATVLDRMRRFEDAAKEYEAAAKLNPADAPTQYRLARVYGRLGREEDARRAREEHEKLTRGQDSAR